jgi:UDP-N-acetyl-D-glucosamine dehydrogenase
MKAGVDFHLAFSPEREDPGNPDSKVASIPKVVGGYTPACLDRAKALYGRAIKNIVPVSSCRVAEATKLLENIFRSVNIALVNELKVVYSAGLGRALHRCRSGGAHPRHKNFAQAMILAAFLLK